MGTQSLIKKAAIAGFICLLLVFMGSVLLGKLSGYEAKILINKSLSGINTLCNTIALASATILALLLTVLSISSNSKSKLRKEHYYLVLQIAKWDTAVFISAIVSFVILNLPIAESENLPINWFNYIYYISLGVISLLTAGLVSVVLMLYHTIVNIIKIIGLNIQDHPLAVPIEDCENSKKN